VPKWKWDWCWPATGRGCRGGDGELPIGSAASDYCALSLFGGIHGTIVNCYLASVSVNNTLPLSSVYQISPDIHCHLPEKSQSSTAGNNGAPTSVLLSLGHALYVWCGRQNITRCLCRVNLRVETQCDSQKTILRYLVGRADDPHDAASHRLRTGDKSYRIQRSTADLMKSFQFVKELILFEIHDWNKIKS
jgi:hypothetical protein